MKIRRFQIVIQPCRYPSFQDEYRDLSIEVVTDGRVAMTSHIIRNSDFEDTLGAIMREAERSIRRSFREGEVKNSP